MNRRGMKWLRLALVASALAVGGCGASLPPVADGERARAALQATLDAWRDGASDESLQKRKPPIFVNEPDWRTGRKLVRYELGAGERHGQSWRCEVQLTFADDASDAAPTAARYLVDTDPATVVVRE